ncbi:hypothetical protein [Sinomonas gamaensis]|uniref:hypothetical protein n=1 Tax=Sinomonas gamaensis TaxID=2565624 RepID=UPI0011092AAD|nr:hypothetical protein [Sinomonas gamaensis]
MQSSTPSSPGQARPVQLVVLVAIVWLEALVLLALAVLYGIELANGQAQVSPGGAIFTMVLLALFGVGIAFAGLLLARGYRWTRSAVLVVQLFAATIGLPTMTGGYVLYGLLILVPAAAALVLLFTKPVFAATQRAVRSSAD